MSLTPATWPNIWRAAHAIALDNEPGTVDDEMVLGMVEAAIDGRSVEALRAVDVYLGALSDDYFETVCIGEVTERVALGIPADVDALLEALFESL